VELREFEPLPRREPRPSCLRQLGCLIGGLFTFLIPLAIGGFALAIVIDRLAPGFLEFDAETAVARFDAARAVVLSEIGENPHLTPEQPRGALPLCDDVPPAYGHAFRLAFGLMRGTDEGERLYDLLIENDICIHVDDLAYNTAYASSRSVRGDWSSSTIVVDRRYVRSLQADVLAAILVHEATHLDRAISGDACYFNLDEAGDDTCTTLPNGVTLEEELAAHSAEAAWWIAAYGDDGKSLAWQNDYAENSLAKAYLQGAAFFRTYVTQIRSSTREGEGF
jgi:hypothetical protein